VQTLYCLDVEETHNFVTTDVVVHNCQPPLNNLKLFLHQTKKVNDLRVEHELEPLPTPLQACQPHLLRQVRETPNALLLGATAHWALTGQRKGIRKIRGAFMDRWITQDDQFITGMDPNTPGEMLPPGITRLRIVPTLHPAYVLRAPVWQVALHQDVGRFFRWLNGNLHWVTPKLITLPSAAQLERFLYDPKIPFHTVDIETDGKDTLSCNTRCIGIATPEGGMVVPLLGVEGEKGKLSGHRPLSHRWGLEHGVLSEDQGIPYYSDEEGAYIVALLQRWLMDPQRIKVGHNFGSFDACVLIRELGLPGPPAPMIDTILLFRGAHSDLSRDLYTLGTLYSDVPDWKSAEDDRKVAVNPRTDQELWSYCTVDTTVDARCLGPLIKVNNERNQGRAIVVDHDVQRIGRQMHELGLRVDQAKREELEEEKTAEKIRRLGAIRDAVGDPKFNANSTQQLGRLFYDDWRLPILSVSEDTGEPSTDDDSLRQFIFGGILSPLQLEVVKALRAYRKVAKQLSTYIIPLRPWNVYRKNKDGKMVGGLCGRDGRIHPTTNVHTPATGRISISHPSAQNFVKALRKMVIPAPGMVFVGADYDQIELRLVCAVARVESYLKTFLAGGDPHAMTALLVYGDTFKQALVESLTPEQQQHFFRTGVPGKAEAGTDLYNALRRFAKTFVYAVLYGGTAKTVYTNVSAAEDPKTGELLFPDMTLSDVRAAYNRFMRNASQLPKWWEDTWGFARRHGYVVEPILGRRRDFPRFERNEILNHPIQGGAASIMGLGLVRLDSRIPMNAYGPYTGIINQCHDAVTLEVPEARAEEVQEIVTESLRSRFDQLPGIEFTAEANIAMSWDKAA